MKFVSSLFLAIIVFIQGYAQQRLSHIQEDNRQIIETEKKAFIAQKNLRVNGTAASANFHINYARCEWSIDPGVRFITGKVTSYFTITSATNKIVFDLSDTLIVDSITYHSTPISFQRNGNDALQIQFPAVLPTGKTDSVSIYYKGVPRTSGAAMAFYTTKHNGNIPVLFTLSEPYGGKEWWPCKNGLTDKTDSIDIILSCPDIYSGTTNGLLVREDIQNGKKTSYYKHRYPIATYLVGIACTNYVRDVDSVQLASKTMPVIMNAYPEFEDYYQANTYYAKQSLQKLSELFGEYPFSKEHYSQTQINANGGMEHQTNTFIGGGVNNQLVTHELGHHWFGDKVTCKSWEHIWLNEGFADYTEFIYVENFDNSLKQLHLQAHLNLAVHDSSGSVFVTDTTDAARIFSNNLTYMKGGYVVHMLRGILGDSIFFKGIRTYLNDPTLQYNFASTQDLQRNLESFSGKNLSSFFKKWIYGEGYPNYNANWYQNNNGWIRVQLNQTTTHPSVSFYEMPVQLRFKNNSRDTIITVDHQLSGQVFWINPGFVPDSMFIDPYLWILAKERITTKVQAPSREPDFIKIYPNPAPSVLYLSLLNPISSNIRIELYSSIGQLVYQSARKLNGQDEFITIPTAGLSPGTYVVKVTNDKDVLVVKKIVR